MSGQNFFNGQFQPLVLNESGQPVLAAGYKAKWYAAGTDIPKTIYTDAARTTPYPTPPNIAFLDETTGTALIYLGAGGYKLVLTDPNDVPVPNWTIDDIDGDVSFGTGFVNSFEDLKNVNTDTFPYTYIGGYYSPGDGGEGMFYNKVSAAALDGGYVQESVFDTAKRWFRIPDENGDVRAASFGFVPSASGDQTSNLLAADAYAASIGARLRIMYAATTNNYTGEFTLNAPTVVFDQNAYINGSTSLPNMTINGVVEAGGWRILANYGVVSLANPKQESRPEWFGASTTGTAAANATSFSEWKGAGAGVFVLPPGSWKHTGSFTPVSDKLTIFLGEILDGDGPAIGTKPGTFYGPASLLSGNLSLTLTGAFGFAGNMTLSGTFTHTGDSAQTGNSSQTGNADIDGTLTVSGQSTINNQLIVTGQINGQDAITAGDTITAASSIAAGGDSGKPGFISPRMGNSNSSFKASGSGQVVIGSGDATLPANALIATGDYIRIVIAGTTNAATPTITVTLGGTTIFSVSMASSAATTAAYHAEITVIRTNTTSSLATGFATMNATGATRVPAASDLRFPAIDWSTSLTIAHTASDTNAKSLTMYEVYPI